MASRAVIRLHPLFSIPYLLLLLPACATARRDEPLAGPMPLSDPKLVAGQQVFMRNCHQCHPGGAAGLGPAINNKPLPAFAIKAQVRKGVGAMPAFDDGRIPDADLDNLTAYLQTLRKQDGD
jgi:mono/diheme cytochrome c family protein